MLFRFKYVNNKFGHPPGDKILKTLVKIIKKRLRELKDVTKAVGDALYKTKTEGRNTVVAL
ncbi:MAG: diguanylate cyclase [Desulfarculaceae bacterium]|nr:diguanylate cyclase [Desulfarculaceae bacterium]